MKAFALHGTDPSSILGSDVLSFCSKPTVLLHVDVSVRYRPAVGFKIRDFRVVLGQAEVYLGSLLHEFPPECPAMSGFPAITFGV